MNIVVMLILILMIIALILFIVGALVLDEVLNKIELQDVEKNDNEK